jgi:YD repeat-containing protein
MAENYGNSTHPHAVTGLSDGSSYTYDANGSMISRTRNGVTTTFTYNGDREAPLERSVRGNKLVMVQEGGNTIAQFVYDGDGNRVQSTINAVTTRFVGEYYEASGTDVTKYYGGQAAIRVNGTVSYLLADHLPLPLRYGVLRFAPRGSNALILDSTGNVVGETRYKAWGEIRYSSGSSTDYTYTGQYSNTSDFGWMYYAVFAPPSAARGARPAGMTLCWAGLIRRIRLCRTKMAQLRLIGSLTLRITQSDSMIQVGMTLDVLEKTHQVVVRLPLLVDQTPHIKFQFKQFQG